MEKRTNTISSILFITNGITLIICMFMNWLPINLKWETTQFVEVFGKINAFTLSDHINELGEWLRLLPEEFSWLMIESVIMTVCASATVVLYVCGIVLHILRIVGTFKKEAYIELVTLAAVASAILTCALFCVAIDNAIGLTSFEYSALSIVKKTPWINVVLSAVACTVFTRKAVVEAIIKVVLYLTEWVKAIVNNFGFLVSDVIGAFAGISAGKVIASLTGSALLGVITGLGIACLIAVVCCIIVCWLFGKEFT